MHQPFMPIAKSVLITAVLATVVWVSAGSLTPPVGPVTPTMKNLSDVEPRTAIRNQFDTLTPVLINFSGSFYLAEDILALPGQHGIEIDAAHVTLDLNGFTVYGNLEVGSQAGIFINDNRHNITIRNGTVRDFNWYGVYGAISDGGILEDVRVINNGLQGIFLRNYALVRNCMAINSGTEDGIRVNSHSIVTGCVSWSNGNDLNDAGIRVAGAAGVVANCVAADNAGNGIRAGSASTITGSSALNNVGNGLDASSVGHVVDSTASGNAINISATSVHNSYGP